MKERYAFLHLEDNANDAELIRTILEDAGILADFTVVQSRDALVDRLQHGDFDLVISDFSIPSFSGRRALEISRDLRPDIPFIFVSGTIGEDAAIESLVMGATDYVLKTKLTRLVPAVRRALLERDEAVRRQRAERAVRESEERFRNFVENINEVIFAVDLQGRFTYVSPVIRDLAGYEPGELVGKPVTTFIEPSDVQKISENIRMVLGGNLGAGEYRVMDKSGNVRWVRTSTRPIFREGTVTGLQGVFTDVTERIQLEEQIRRQQRLESLGTLVGGVAHDFNNILGIAIGHAGLLQRWRDEPGRFEESLNAINTALRRGSGLVRQLLTFARKGDINVEPLDVNTIVRELARLLRQTLPKMVEMHVDLGQDVPMIKADGTQVNQVLLNLCVNARDAMPDGGTIRIRTYAVGRSAIARRFPDAGADRYVVVEVGDTGSGMDDATKARIFEPFFTTKDPGKGTGLGLSVVFGVVQSHKGLIDVESAPDKGTAFRIFFPVEGPTVADVGKVNGKVAEPARGSETVLIVEDEEFLLQAISMAFDDYGYKVVEAKDGVEALETYRRNAATIGLVLMDMDLPKMSGNDLIREIIAINPAAKIIATSGFVDVSLRDEILQAGARVFVPKPYDHVELLTLVRKLLDEPEGQIPVPGK